MNDILNNLYYLEDSLNNMNFVKKKVFKKGEIITTYIAKRQQYILLTEGEADLIRYDINGNKAIIEKYFDKDLFGDVFNTIYTNNELFVEAKKKCEVLIFNYEDILKCYQKDIKYKKVIEALFSVYTDKILVMNNRIEVLTKRTIREKLLSYFQIMTSRKLKKSFYLPFTYTDLADYLSIDRSAMMRELKNLIDDGIIKKEAEKITLLF